MFWTFYLYCLHSSLRVKFFMIFAVLDAFIYLFMFATNTRQGRIVHNPNVQWCNVFLQRFESALNARFFLFAVSHTVRD